MPVSAPLQSYSKHDYIFNIHLVTYTESIQENRKKRRFKKSILRTNCLIFLTCFFSFKKNTFFVIEHITNTSFQKNRNRLCNCPERRVAVFSNSFLCRFSNLLLNQSQEWISYCRVFSIELKFDFVSCVLIIL